MEGIIYLILFMNLLMVLGVAQNAKETGRNWLVWAVIVFIFGIFGLVLYFYDIDRHPTDKQAKQAKRSLRVYGDVVDSNGQEKTVGLTFQSNSWTKSEAKEAFRESCAEKGLALTGEPTVTIESNKPDMKKSNSSGDETEKIGELKNLRDSGAITEEEFQEKKTVLLNRL
ncbi:SHOCT domain-containing protein [Natronoglomus mannanivorans]|uniref:SHOCT domain-containing protein n=1 Tax=Natronoglomus mannanivorans TaxID=2979990 RepID=A0AAP3E1X4_9EURY|nr:SHOCT domain-containing protein [Halobacteria archaeon AArc-xg1-1]